MTERPLPTPVRLAAFAALYVCQRAGDVFDRALGTYDRRVVVTSALWCLAPDEHVPKARRLLMDECEGEALPYPTRVQHVERVGPFVIVSDAAYEERGRIFVLRASYEITDGTLAAVYARDKADFEARIAADIAAMEAESAETGDER